MLFILFYCFEYYNKTTDARYFIKWGGKINKITFCRAKLLNF